MPEWLDRYRSETPGSLEARSLEILGSKEYLMEVPRQDSQIYHPHKSVRPLCHAHALASTWHTQEWFLKDMEPRQDFLENLEELRDFRELQEDPKEEEPFTEPLKSLKEHSKDLPMERLKPLKGALVHKDQVVGTDFRARWVESNRVKGMKTGVTIDGCVTTPEYSRSRLLKSLRTNLTVGRLGRNGGAKPEAI